MRQLLLLITVSLAATVGCGGPRQDVRLSSSVPVEPPQQQLDGIAANFLNNLVGGVR